MERPQLGAAGRAAPDGGGRPFEDALGRLTDPQRAAVESEASPLCIVAGAGSGKTSVLTLRAAARIRRGSADPDHTVVCTFTRKAAAELRRRLASFGVPVSVAGPGRVPSPGVRAGTIHQLALTLIRRHCLDTGRALPLVVEHRAALLRSVTDGPGTSATLGAEIAWAKARGLGPAGYEEALAAGARHPPSSTEAMVGGFREYQAALARRGALDLDDLLVRATALLADDGAFAERMRWRYRHLCVDEFQDVNPAQFQLVRTLLGDSRDVCVVGDPHQAIYGWNGADPTLLDRLPELLGPVTVLELADNHRSTGPVVALADAVLGEQRRYRARAVVPDGPAPVLAVYDDERAEAEGAAEVIGTRHAEGVPWSEQAVLARTHDQLSVVARALVRAGIPHRMTAAADDALERPTGVEGWGGDVDPGGAAGTARVDAVELATFHRAKGAEWTSVVVTGIEDGYVPIVHAVGEEARAEERRLLYVACTRASRHLTCSWARRRTTVTGRVVERAPSPWLPIGPGAPARLSPAAGRGDDPYGGTPRAGVADRIADLRAALDGR